MCTLCSWMQYLLVYSGVLRSMQLKHVFLWVCLCWIMPKLIQNKRAKYLHSREISLQIWIWIQFDWIMWLVGCCLQGGIHTKCWFRKVFTSSWSLNSFLIFGLGFALDNFCDVSSKKIENNKGSIWINSDLVMLILSVTLP